MIDEGRKMRPLKAMVVLALTSLLAMPVLPAEPGSDEKAPTPRSEWRQGGPVEVELKANGSIYESTAFRIPVPANASVTSACVDLTGRYVKGSLTYKACDYNEDTAGHKAYKGIVSGFSRDRTRVWSMATGEVSSNELSSVQSSDDDYLEQAGDFQGDNDGFELFRLRVPVDESRTIIVNWEGHAEYYGQVMPYAVYIWNNLTAIWELIDTGSSATDRRINAQFDGDWYIDNRSVWVMALNDNGGFVLTDYVNISISGYPFIYPKNPAMDIGGDGRAEWSLKENQFDYTVSVAESAMIAAMDEGARNSAAQFANVTVRFVSDTPCKMRVSFFAFNFSAPPWCRGIPNIGIDEDSSTTSVLDLNNYFIDDIDKKLSYQVTYQQDAKKAQASIGPDNHTLDLKTVTRNWWGTLRFRVAATDSEGLAGESGNFTVTVRPVNDPPVISQVADQTASQGVPYSYKITARDVDSDLDPTETVTYNDSVSFLAIDPRTGWMNFTPKQTDVGTWYICVTATDNAGAVGSQVFTMVIEDVEDPPVMKTIPDLKATELEKFSYTVVVTDPDLPYGDSLNFTDDCPLFNISRETGLIEFTPTVWEVGFYRGNITVKDTRGGQDRRMFNLSVFNSIGSFDHPPTVEAIPNFKLVAGTPFRYQVNASDIDEDDVLSYKDNCPVFAIGAANGTISFTPKDSDAGTYTVRITVTDWEGLEAQTTFKLEILKFNSPPNITRVKPKNGFKVLFDHEVVLSADATDPEGDRLTYTWIEGNRTLGRGSSIVTMFAMPGTYVVTLIVSDGRDESRQNITIKVVTKLDEPKKSPGFEWAMAASALVLAAVAIARRRRG